MKEYTEFGDEILYKDINMSKAKTTVMKDVYFFVINWREVKENGICTAYGDIIATSTTDPYFNHLWDKYEKYAVGVLIGVDLFRKVDQGNYFEDLS